MSSTVPISDKLMKKRITTNILQNGYSEDMALIVSNLYDYMRQKKLFGCCHAFSSVLYVAITESGYNPVLYIGECQTDETNQYDHSWITIDEKIIDLAIYMPLTQKINSVTGPIVLDTDMVTMKKYNSTYGINTGLPFSSETQQVIRLPFVQYMDAFPFEKNGLWGAYSLVVPLHLQKDMQYLKQKYAAVKRTLIR